MEVELQVKDLVRDFHPMKLLQRPLHFLTLIAYGIPWNRTA